MRESPYAFEEWKLRVMTKFNAVSKEADEKQKGFKLGELGARILDGLSADALRIAMDMGSEALTKPDGVPVLVDKIEKSIMGQREDEATRITSHCKAWRPDIKTTGRKDDQLHTAPATLVPKDSDLGFQYGHLREPQVGLSFDECRLVGRSGCLREDSSRQRIHIRLCGG